MNQEEMSDDKQIEEIKSGEKKSVATLNSRMLQQIEKYIKSQARRGISTQKLLNDLIKNKFNVKKIEQIKIEKYEEVCALIGLQPQTEQIEQKTRKQYIQQEIVGMKKRGGWRGGGRPKTTGQTTVAIRIDKRLEKLVNALKEELKNGRLDEKKIESLLMSTQKQKG